MGHLLYFLSILIIGGLGMSPAICFARRDIYKYRRLIYIVAAIFLVGSLTDTVAHRWGVWGYGFKQTLHTRWLGVEVETIVFCVVTGLAVTLAAILWADDVDNNRSFLDRFKPLYKFLDKSQKKM
jgi:hypothetical protein